MKAPIPADIEIKNEPAIDLCKKAQTQPRGHRRVAVLTIHGMGQQVCYGTLNSVAEALSQTARQHGAIPKPEIPIGKVVRLGEHTLGHVQMHIEKEQKVREVHLYEAYWSPLTAGKIGVVEVLAFLFEAGLHGLRHWAADDGCFKYRAFGKEQTVPIPWTTPLALSACIFGIGIVLLLSAVVLLMALGHTLHVTPRMPVNLCHDILLVGSWGVFACLAALVLVLLSGFLAGLPRIFLPLISYWTWTALGIWVTFVAILGLNFHEVSNFIGTAANLLANWGTLDEVGFAVLFATPLVIYGLARLRYFLVEFVGDVAIYVTAHTDDRFWEVRECIQKLCRDTALELYRAKDRFGKLLYDDVIIVGHSLGSVVGYEALNAIVVEDQVQEGVLRVADRTKLFLTIGSPLDKVTYLFRSQITGAKYRDAVDSAWAPVASCIEVREKLKWVNIRAPWDFISGELEYFDMHPAQESAPPPVRNVVEQGVTANLAAAHTQYWKRPCFREELFNGVFGTDDGRSSAAGV